MFGPFTLASEDDEVDALDLATDVYKLRADNLRVLIDFGLGVITVDRSKVGFANLDPLNGVDVEIQMGDDLGVENAPIREGADTKLIYRRNDE